MEKSQGAWIGETKEGENQSDSCKFISTLMSFIWLRIIVVRYEAVVHLLSLYQLEV